MELNYLIFLSKFEINFNIYQFLLGIQDEEEVITILTFELNIPGRWFRKQYSVNFRRKPSGNSPFLAGTGRKIPEIWCKYPASVSSCLFRRVRVGSGRNRINPVTGSVHRNTASMKSADPTGSLADWSTWDDNATFLSGKIFFTNILVQLNIHLYNKYHHYNDYLLNVLISFHINSINTPLFSGLN